MRLAAAVLIGLALVCGPALADDSAAGQLDDATDGQQTTGTTFDGCDAQCQGIDTTVNGGDSNVPEPPPPTPVEE